MNDDFKPVQIAMPSGLKVIMLYRPYGKTFAASLMYRVGSFNDPSGFPGMSHLAEHLVFQGPNREIAAKLGDSGADLNGTTAHEYTQFHASGHIEQLDLALEFFANIAQNSMIDEQGFSLERKVISHEMADQDDSSSREISFDAFWRRTLGDPNWRASQKAQAAKISAVKLDDINSFMQTYYRPENACLAIVAPTDRNILQSVIERGGLRDSDEVGSSRASTRRSKDGHAALTINFDRHRYIWLNIIHTVGSTAPITRLVGDILGHLLGGRPHSEMFRKLRSERSIAYSVHAVDYAYLERTALSCFCSVPKRSVHEALGIVLNMLDTIAKNGISEETFQAEKSRMMRRHEISMDHPAGLASYVSYEALRPQVEALVQPDAYLDSLAALTSEDVNRTAAELLSATHRSIFVGGRVGPIDRFLIRRRLKYGQ